MKSTLAFFASLTLTLLLFSCTHKAQSPLFRYWENNKFGYIDRQGNVIIPARFEVAGDFSEERATVREGGYYGYIDTKGTWIVPPVYEYATSLSDGLALAYSGEKARYIDRDGNVAFHAGYSSVEPFFHGVAIVGSWNKKYGVVDNKGHLIYDTIYSNIEVGDNYFSLFKPGDSTCVVDRKGNFIVPYGKYFDLAAIGNGHFLFIEYDTVYHKSKKTLVDSTGKGLFSIEGVDIDIEPGMSVDRFAFSEWREEKYNVYGIIDNSGRVIYKDSTIHGLYPFHGNRSFIRRGFSRLVITGDGKIIGPEFTAVLKDRFDRNVAFVSNGSKWGMIDTNANYIIPPKFDRIMEPGLIGDIFFFQGKAKDHKSPKFGIADKSGRIVLPACLDNYDPNGFKNGLLLCLLKNRISYINEVGKVIWQEKADPSLRPLNIDYMQRGYFYVETEPGVSNGQETDKGLRLQVQPHTKDTFDTRYKACKVLICNNTADTIQFDAQDNRLYMKIQAYIEYKWRDIEYLPSSWCGNSYHTLALPPHRNWQLKCPVYAGVIKTKLRIALTLRKGEDNGTVYSNEFDGSINPGQLWRKKGHQPVNIMDPYEE